MEYAFERQKALESGALRKVGVNCYTDSDEEKPQVDLHGYDEMGAIEQIDLRARCARRATTRPSKARSAVRTEAKAGRNVMPLMDAVKAYATVGEMTNALVDIYGRFQEPTNSGARSLS